MKHSSWILVLAAVSPLLPQASCGVSERIPLGNAGAGGERTSASSAHAGNTSASASSGGTGGTAGTGGTSGTGGGTPLNSGDCKSDADCPGSKCVELSPGGFRVCQVLPVEATACGSPADKCCTSADCMLGGKCFQTPIIPICGGPTKAPYNACAYDQCGSNADCAKGQICVAPGLYGPKVRTCLQPSCILDTDCAMSTPGGTCALVASPCCDGVSPGLFCVPAVNGCRKNADCPNGSYCGIDGMNRAVCTPGSPICPH